MVTCVEAIIEAFRALGGDRSFDEIENWVLKKYGAKWKRIAIETCMADMVPEELGGNPTSTVKSEYKVLRRLDKAVYTLK